MANFTPVAYLDTWELAVSLKPRLGLFKIDTENGTSVIMLRGPRFNADDPDDELGYVQMREAGKWEEYKNTLKRITRVGAATLGALDFGRIYFELLPPGVVTPWRSGSPGYAERFLRAHLPIRTNPQAVMFSGTEGASLLPGHLTVVNRMPPSSAINMGDHARVHLVIDFRQKPKEPTP